MKHLILGSQGQIGRHLREYLKLSGEEVIEFDILRSISEDLRVYNNMTLLKSMQESDMVHFLAFDIGGSQYMSSFQDSFSFLSNNIKIMNNVFDVLESSKKPFIFVSSQMSNMLHSTYGILKLIGERYTHALNGIVVKLWNVYGYENDPEKSHVITDFIQMAKQKQCIKMRTDGKEERQFLYADDCSEFLYLVSNTYEKLDRKYPLHITSFEWVTILDIAKMVSSEFNNCKIIPGTNKDTVQQNMRNEPDDYILNLWKPNTSLRQGISNIIDLMK